MIARIALAVAFLIVVAVLALSAYVRLAPLDPDRWHLALADSDPAVGTCRDSITELVNGARSACALPGTPAEILAKLDTVALVSPRTTRLAGSPEEGRITWVSRTRIMGYPDAITAQASATATGTRLDVFSRQVYGSGDWGVNAARLNDWLAPF